jgi:ABC-type lipoprotein export system ATPase subunit
VLADEPTAALDKKSGREVVELMQKLAKEQHCTILLATHDNRILDIVKTPIAVNEPKSSLAFCTITNNRKFKKHLSYN